MTGRTGPTPKSLLSFLLLLFACSCGDSSPPSSSSSSPQRAPVARLAVTPSTVSLAVGERRQLTVEARDALGNVISDVPVTWESSNPAVATVEPSGKVSGEAIGIAEIVASFDGIVSAQSRVGVYSATHTGSLGGRLSGVALYEDARFDLDGMTGVIEREPIPLATVEVIRLFDFSTIARAITNEDGTFSIPVSNPEPAGVYVRVTTQSESVQVLNGPRGSALYAVVSDGLDDSVDNPGLTLVASQATLAGHAFNVYAALMQGVMKVRSLLPALPVAIAFWQPAGPGTFYEDVEDRIYVSGSSIDPDENDDAVILHEYGHFLAHHFSRDDSPGGLHSVLDNTEDIRLAWSEGWADFFSSAARGSSLYVDTNGAGRSRLSFDLETVSSPVLPTLAARARYTTSEVAVAAVVWDFYDNSPAEAFDQAALDFTDLWKAFLDFTSTSFIFRTASFELYWDALRARVPSLPASDLVSITRERQIELVADSYEPDDETPQELTSGVAQKHTLFAGNDVDRRWFSLPGGDWVIETRNLSNGADTVLEITDGGGNFISRSDNRGGRLYSKSCGVSTFTQTSTCPPNDGTTLSSFVSLVSAPAGAYRASVRRSPDAPPSAGIYGTYEILLHPLE